jgi:hypothetical protein
VFHTFVATTPAVTEDGRVRRPGRRKQPPTFWFLANAGARNFPCVVPTSRDDRLTRVRAVRSIRAKPGIAVKRHSFPSPYCLAFPQNLHDPQTRRGMATPSISCTRLHGIGRVGLGGLPPRPPTDPDVQNSSIRFLTPQLRCMAQQRWTTRAGGSL